MTKAYAARKAKPVPPTQEAKRVAKLLDESSKTRPLKPPGVVKCRVCWDRGCKLCKRSGVK